MLSHYAMKATLKKWTMSEAAVYSYRLTFGLVSMETL